MLRLACSSQASEGCRPALKSHPCHRLCFAVHATERCASVPEHPRNMAARRRGVVRIVPRTAPARGAKAPAICCVPAELLAAYARAMPRRARQEVAPSSLRERRYTSSMSLRGWQDRARLSCCAKKYTGAAYRPSLRVGAVMLQVSRERLSRGPRVYIRSACYTYGIYRRRRAMFICGENIVIMSMLQRHTGSISPCAAARQYEQTSCRSSAQRKALALLFFARVDAGACSHGARGGEEGAYSRVHMLFCYT